MVASSEPEDALDRTDIRERYSLAEMPPFETDGSSVQVDQSEQEVKAGDVIVRDFSHGITRLAVLQIQPEEFICWRLDRSEYFVYPKSFLSEDLVGDIDTRILNDPWGVRADAETDFILIVSDTGRNLHTFEDPVGAWRKEAGDDHQFIVKLTSGDTESVWNGRPVYVGSPADLPDPENLEDKHTTLSGRLRWGCSL